MNTRDGLLLGGAALALYLAWQARQAAAAVAGKVNPYNRDNLIYQDVVGGLGRAVTGDKDWSLGGWLYDVINPNQPDPTAPTPMPTLNNPAPGPYDWLP